MLMFFSGQSREMFMLIDLDTENKTGKFGQKYYK